jgi:hypothetical protein
VFGTNDVVYLNIPEQLGQNSLIEFTTSGCQARSNDDALVLALSHLGLSLSTPYFALHTGPLPWARYRRESKRN